MTTLYQVLRIPALGPMVVPDLDLGEGHYLPLEPPEAYEYFARRGYRVAYRGEELHIRKEET
jgi:hypothetical protein